MTEKVKLTKEQAEALKVFNEFNNGNNYKLEYFFAHRNDFTDIYKPLKEIEIDKMARLLYQPNSYEIEEEYKVGDWVARTTNGEDSRAVFKEGRVFQIVNEVPEDRVFAGHLNCNEGFCHNPKHIRHATPEEIKAEQERRVWAEVQSGDVLIGKATGRYAALLKLHPAHGIAEVLVRNGDFESWDIATCKPYAKKLGDSNA